MAKRRKSSSRLATFSVESLREEVDEEISTEKIGTKLLEDLRVLNLKRVEHVSPNIVLCAVTVKFGLALVCCIARVVPGLRVLPIDVRRQVVKMLCPQVSEEDGDTLFQCVASLPDFPNSTATESDAFHVFSPPCDRCVRCHSHLVRYNNPVEVDYHHLNGSSKGVKCSLKCSRCDIFYGYTKYGNPVSGWNLYSAPRPAVEASDVCFVQRTLLKFQISLACHSWVSFSGFSTAFNELHDLHTGLSEKLAANAFWNGELEAELRERGALDMFGMFHTDSDREVIMERIDHLRAKNNYLHQPQDCTDDCKARGCGKLWVADGQWKLMFAHCMMKRKNVVNGLPVVNYPDVCTSAPVHGKAFCQEHLDFLTANHPTVPTDIRGFLKHCGVIKHSDTPEGIDDATLSTDETQKVETVVNSLMDSTATSLGQSTVLSQGNEEMFSQANSNALLHDCEEATPTACNKETGEKRRLQKWSRGHFFIVRGSGIIDKWNPLFRSESPSQAFLIILNWLSIILKRLSPSSWGEIYLAYDNMCHVDGMKVAKKPLPLPAPFDKMWSAINKVIDSLHIRNHKDTECKKKYDPVKLKEQLPGMNTMAAEQTFVWLARFKKILCSMPKTHHLFFLHRIVLYRNRYTVSCYKRGLKPLLPSARSANTK